ncbi:thioredoxin-like 2-2, chloroplastic [Andrographis paniculata]|uniref:thioredoxin-like 2-2, chloroplastic n=1 Tax=Andrographis paniculata TaxID=175694 RepID=UPI0021E77F34|nr:thioredoxin-like 2-2, chloroplastic [Andrographis paniculata]
MNAAVAEAEEPKWWQRDTSPNMIDVHSTQDRRPESSRGQASHRRVLHNMCLNFLVRTTLVHYDTLIRGCLNQLCKTAEEHPEIVFLKVDYDENKPMRKRLNVKVLP